MPAEFADLQGVSTTADLDAFERERVLDRIARMPKAPSLTTIRALPAVNGHWRRADPSRSVPVARHAVLIEVEGDARLLEYWPDKEDSELRPIDLDVVDELGQAIATDAGEGTTARYWDAVQTWQYVKTPGSPNQIPTAIVTHQDLTREEERAATSTNVIRDAFVERRRQSEPIVAAIARQTEQYYSVDLPERIAEIVRVKREEFGNREAVTSSLTFPSEWLAAEPALDPDLNVQVDTTTEATDERAKGDGPRDLGPGHIVLNPRARLSLASFADVQRTIRVWADSIE